MKTGPVYYQRSTLKLLFCCEMLRISFTVNKNLLKLINVLISLYFPAHAFSSLEIIGRKALEDILQGNSYMLALITTETNNCSDNME